MNRPIIKDCAYVFAIKWSPDNSEYNIHGLWPEVDYVHCNHPETIAKNEFDQQILRDATLLKTLEVVWNSDMHKPIDKTESESKISEILLNANLKFWEHEWYKHGMYSNLALEPFFDKAIELYYAHRPQLPAHNENHQLHYYLDINYAVIKTDLYVITTL
jgi:ribonuclease I